LRVREIERQEKMARSDSDHEEMMDDREIESDDNEMSVSEVSLKTKAAKADFSVLGVKQGFSPKENDKSITPVDRSETKTPKEMLKHVVGLLHAVM